MSNTLEENIKLDWLVRLRWGALLGELCVYLLAKYALGFEISCWPIVIILLIGAISNFVLLCNIRNSRIEYSTCVGLVLLLDVALLTTLLYFYGGYTNPFSTVYLVHVILAAFLLGAAWTWGMFLLCSICFTLLFFFNLPISELAVHHSHGSETGFSLHLQGMLFGFLLIGALLSFFLTKMGAEILAQQEELEELKDKEALESKLVSLATLSAGAAHELSTPLCTVALILEELKGKSSSYPELLAELNAIELELTRCRLIIDRMRVQGTELQGELFEVLSIEEVFSETREQLEELGDRVRFSSKNAKLNFRTLRKSLIHAIAALVKNGIQASKSNAFVEVSAEEESGKVVFSIVDSGSGIKGDIISRVGEPFFTTKEPGEGMGLGVFLVRAFVKRINGKFDIISKEGLGTSTILSVPINSESLA